ncbi:hypothetical protein ACFYS8_26205 [Kitasatospora sp. NPDC004615]|uniref:hypothetical protein n=1 Tax=Kitasatospora sp. NPDC004615 TaxID=3364017 RepID=UPI0036BC2F4D
MTVVTGSGKFDQGISSELHGARPNLGFRQEIGDLVPVLGGYVACRANIHFG